MLIDNLFFEFLHILCEVAGGVLTPFFKFITLLGEKGFIFLLIAFVLFLRRKTRWVGATIILSIFLAYIFGDVILKPMIGRIRPYQSAVPNLYDYWIMAGQVEESGYSMPSGHTLACASFFISLIITVPRNYRLKLIKPAIICTIIMICSRCYLLAHHLTDCLFAVVLSFVFSYVAKCIVKLIYNMCKNHQNFPLWNLALNFDFFELFAPKK